MYATEAVRLKMSACFTSQAIRDFANMIGDPNKIHQGPYVHGARERKQIVVGLQLLGVLSRMAAEAYPGACAAVIQAEFRRPVYADEEATFTCDITEATDQQIYFSAQIQVGNRLCVTGAFNITIPKTASS